MVPGPPLALGTPKPTFLEKWPNKPLGAGPASEGPLACALLCVSVPTHTPACSFLSPGGGAEAENILEPPSQQHSHPTPCAGLGELLPETDGWDTALDRGNCPQLGGCQG